MAFDWITGGELKKRLAVKDAEIAKLTQELADSQNETTLKDSLTALFGDAAKAEDFDLTAAVEGLINNSTALEASVAKKDGELTAATNRLNEVAVALGLESAGDVDLAAKVKELEPEGTTKPTRNVEHTVNPESEFAEFRCALDDKLENDLKS